MIYGVGWTQRWEVAAGAEAATRREIERVGRDDTGNLRVVDPGTGADTTLVLAWRHVVAAVLLDAGGEPVDQSGPGQYP